MPIANLVTIVSNYIDAIYAQSAGIREVNAALKKLDSENAFFGINSYAFEQAMDAFIKMAIGEDNFEWIMWYMWDNDFGRGGKDVIIDGVSFIVDSPDVLVKKCFNLADIPALKEASC